MNLQSQSRFSARALLFSLVFAASALIGVGNSMAAATTALAETNANQTVTVKMGSTVSLSLHSMYWDLTALKAGASLQEKGAVIQKPAPLGTAARAGCGVPGSGCGVQTWKFSTVKMGVTHLVASRVSCGEALRCTAANGTFKVTVKVVK